MMETSEGGAEESRGNSGHATSRRRRKKPPSAKGPGLPPMPQSNDKTFDEAKAGDNRITKQSRGLYEDRRTANGTIPLQELLQRSRATEEEKKQKKKRKSGGKKKSGGDANAVSTQPKENKNSAESENLRILKTANHQLPKTVSKLATQNGGMPANSVTNNNRRSSTSKETPVLLASPAKHYKKGKPKTPETNDVIDAGQTSVVSDVLTNECRWSDFEQMSLKNGVQKFGDFEVELTHHTGKGFNFRQATVRFKAKPKPDLTGGENGEIPQRKADSSKPIASFAQAMLFKAEITDTDLRKNIFDCVTAKRQRDVEESRSRDGDKNKPDQKIPNSALSREIVQPATMSFLESEYIYPLRKANPRFPTAVFFCRLCDYHLNSIHHCKDHIKHTDHRKAKTVREVSDMLSGIPAPTRNHCAALTQLLLTTAHDVGRSPAETDLAEKIAQSVNASCSVHLHSECYVRLYGSLSTGFGLVDSDVNLELVYSKSPLDHAQALMGAAHVLSRQPVVNKLKADYACRWPVVRFGWSDTALICALSVRNEQAYCIGSLLRVYSHLWPPLRTLAQCLRNWAKMCGLSNLSTGGIPAYTFDIMLIHYLQQRDVLPVLAITKRLEDYQSDELKSLVPKVTCSLGELWIGFFRYYTIERDNQSTVVSLSQKSTLTRDQKHWNKKRIAVEDPFMPSKNIASMTQPVFDYLQCCLQKSYLYFGIPRTANGPLLVCGAGKLQLEQNLSQTLSSNVASPISSPPDAKFDCPIDPNSPCQLNTEAKSDSLRLENGQAELVPSALEELSSALREEHKSEPPEKSLERPSNGPGSSIRYDREVVLKLAAQANEICPLNDTLMARVNSINQLVKSGAKEQPRIGWEQVNAILQQESAAKFGGADNELGGAVNDSDEWELISPQEQRSYQEQDSNQPIDEADQSTDAVIGQMNALDLREQRGAQPMNEADLSTDSVIGGVSLDASLIGPMKQEQDSTVQPMNEADLSVDSVIGGVSLDASLIGRINSGKRRRESVELVEEEVLCLILDLLDRVVYQLEAEVNNKDPQIQKLIHSLCPEDYCYNFVPQLIFGNLKPVRICTVCSSEKHLMQKCPALYLPPIDRLRPFTPYFHNLLDSFLLDVKRAYAQSSTRAKYQEQFRGELEQFLRRRWPDAQLHLFGSSCNGFGFEQSDLDLCLTFSQTPPEAKFVKVIKQVGRELRKCYQISQVYAVTRAKVPIVKFFDRNGQLEGDISLYNTLALRNTLLLQTYASLDERVPILGAVVKLFAKWCEIGDASRGSLSSYAYILMLIYYLQHTDPPVLPCLQEMYEPGCSKADSEVLVDNWNTHFLSSNQHIERQWSRRNQQSVAELWLGFLRFYVEDFPFEERVVCIRQLRPMTKFEKLWTDRNMTIEDPFLLTHNLGNGISQRMFYYIKRILIKARLAFGISLSEHYLFCTFGKNVNYYSLEKLFFDHLIAVDEEAPRDNVCKACGHVGHFVEQCPLKRKGGAAAKGGGRGQIDAEDSLGEDDDDENSGDSGDEQTNRPLPTGDTMDELFTAAKRDTGPTGFRYMSDKPDIRDTDAFPSLSKVLATTYNSPEVSVPVSKPLTFQNQGNFVNPSSANGQNGSHRPSKLALGGHPHPTSNPAPQVWAGGRSQPTGFRILPEMLFAANVSKPPNSSTVMAPPAHTCPPQSWVGHNSAPATPLYAPGSQSVHAQPFATPTPQSLGRTIWNSAYGGPPGFEGGRPNSQMHPGQPRYPAAPPPSQSHPNTPMRGQPPGLIPVRSSPQPYYPGPPYFPR